MRGDFTRWIDGLFLLAALCGSSVASAAPGDVVPGNAAPNEPAPVQDARKRTGQVVYRPAEKEEMVPAHLRLAEHTFPFEQQPTELTTRDLQVSMLTFPSPVKTPHEANNTVHCEYFRPTNGPARRMPGVIVLHILGGDFPLARTFCYQLASKGTAALFLKMPYYGPRRVADHPARMISPDPHATVAGMKQAVLDIRRAAAWLAAQDEIDPEQLGIMGISLGGIVSALAAEAEPRFQKVGLLLAGGDVTKILWESPKTAPIREKWLAQGGTVEGLQDLLRPIDPVTYAANLKGRKVLMLNAAKDEVIPRACTESLWKAAGEPPIEWWPAGHFSAALYIFDALDRVGRFFECSSTQRPNSAQGLPPEPRTLPEPRKSAE